RAIRLARPGGLGRQAVADVARPPAVTLREAMRLAAARDTIAAEYTRGFPGTVDLALAGLRPARRPGLALVDAVAPAPPAGGARAPRRRPPWPSARVPWCGPAASGPRGGSPRPDASTGTSGVRAIASTPEPRRT